MQFSQSPGKTGTARVRASPISQNPFQSGRLPTGLGKAALRGNRAPAPRRNKNIFPKLGCQICEHRDHPITGRRWRSSVMSSSTMFGTVVNPLGLKGQIHGGVAQGPGQGSVEAVVYAPRNRGRNLGPGSLIGFRDRRRSWLKSGAMGGAQVQPRNPASGSVPVAGSTAVPRHGPRRWAGRRPGRRARRPFAAGQFAVHAVRAKKFPQPAGIRTVSKTHRSPAQKPSMWVTARIGECGNQWVQWR